MSFNGINPKNLTNDDHFQFNTQAKSSMEKTGTVNLNIEALFKQYSSAIEKEDSIMKKISKSEYTALIQTADRNRDAMFNSIVEINKAYLRHFDESTKTSATRLKILFDTYGNISKQSLTAQTSATHNILQELTGKYASDVAKIKLGEWVEKLAEYNSKVGDLMETRYDESAAKITVSLRDVRKEVDEIYRSIIKRIEAFIVIDGIAKYADFVNRLNVVITKYTGKSTKITPSGDNGNVGDIAPDIPLWTADIDYTKMKIGDKRKTSDGRIWEAIDLGQVHRDPAGEFGHFGWKEVTNTESEDEVTYCEEG